MAISLSSSLLTCLPSLGVDSSVLGVSKYDDTRIKVGRDGIELNKGDNNHNCKNEIYIVTIL